MGHGGRGGQARERCLRNQTRPGSRCDAHPRCVFGIDLFAPARASPGAARHGPGRGREPYSELHHGVSDVTSLREGEAGPRVLFHGASGGVGTALLQLGRLAELQMYGTCSSRGAPAVSDLGAIPIDYKNQDVVEEIRRLTGEGVDAVFDPIGGAHLWHSRRALCRGGRVVGYGNTTTLRGEGLGAGRTGRRNRFHGVPVYALYILGGWLLPGRKRIVPYSIQTLKRLKPALFRQDLITLLDLLKEGKIKPIIAKRFPLAEARQAQELLGKGGLIGKIVLEPGGSSNAPGVA